MKDEGYWLNYETGRSVRIRDHEADMRNWVVSWALKVPAKIFKRYGEFKPGADRVRFLSWLMDNAPLMRIRGHGGEFVTFEYASKSNRKPFSAIRAFAKDFAGDLLLNVVNLRSKQDWQVTAKDFGKAGRVNKRPPRRAGAGLRAPSGPSPSSRKERAR